MQKEFENIFFILRTGNQDEVKIAKKKLDQLWKNDRKGFKKNAIFALEQIKTFETIQNPKNQEAFVSGLSLFFFILADSHFQTLKNFVLKVICNPNGHVREQMRRTADWLYISLSSRIDPFVYPIGKKLTQIQIAEQEKAKKEFVEYFKDIESLMEKYDDGSFDQVEYIDEMKPSVYKSLQLLWSDLTWGDHQRDLHIPPAPIISKRKEIEEELSELIQKTKSDITLEEIKNIIYEETEVDDLNDVIRMFDFGSPYELQNAMEVLNDAWNYFPHKILDGLCPAEIVSQPQQKRLLN